MKPVKYVSNGNPNLVVYNPESRNLLCQFVNGEFVTDDEDAIRILDTIASGKFAKHSVQDEIAARQNGKELPEILPELSRADDVEPVASELVEAPIPLEEQTVKQILAYAKENEIAIPKSKKTKAEILAVIDEELESDE